MGKPSHLDRLHFDEFVKSLFPPFPASAGLFVAAERQTRIGLAAIHIDHARAKFRRDAADALGIDVGVLFADAGVGKRADDPTARPRPP